MLYVFGKYAGFVGEYTGILEKNEDCSIPKQQIKIIPDVSLPIFLLLLLNHKFILRYFPLKLLKNIFHLFSKLMDFYLVVAGV